MTTVQHRFLASVLLLAATGWIASAAAGEGQARTQPLGAIREVAAAAVFPPDVTDLKFHEFFKLPIGPRGLEATEKLLALAGKRIRIVGYMVRQDPPARGYFVLSPLPASIGDEDDGLADDLPASVAFVHIGDHPLQALPFRPGLLRLTGTLSLGSREESDGRVSSVRLQLDPQLVTVMLAGEHR